MPPKPEDVREMAARYAEAWSSRSSEAVASFFADTGRVSINNAEPLMGRRAITDKAEDFMSEFSDLVMTLDEIRSAGQNAVFLWTLTGTHSETGKPISIRGWDEWWLSEELLVEISRGRFDELEYDRQITEGV